MLITLNLKYLERFRKLSGVVIAFVIGTSVASGFILSANLDSFRIQFTESDEMEIGAPLFYSQHTIFNLEGGSKVGTCLAK